MDKFFCRECGEVVIWSERKHRWTHESVHDDHAITLAKASDVHHHKKDPSPLLVNREMIGEPLEGQNNIGTTGSLDGRTAVKFSKRKWVELRVIIDQVWELTGGKCPIG